jgi:hypothetical protein
MSQYQRGGPTYSGWMQKKGGGRFTVKWQKRFFQLKDFEIKYYKTENVTKEAQGRIPIFSSSVNGNWCKVYDAPAEKYKKDLVLEIYAPDEDRTYAAICDSKQQRQEWISVIQQAKEELQRAMQSSDDEESEDSEMGDDVPPPLPPGPPPMDYSEGEDSEGLGEAPPLPPAGRGGAVRRGHGSLANLRKSHIMTHAPPALPPSFTKRRSESTGSAGGNQLAELAQFDIERKGVDEDEEDDILEEIPDFGDEADEWLPYKYQTGGDAEEDEGDHPPTLWLNPVTLEVATENPADMPLGERKRSHLATVHEKQGGAALPLVTTKQRRNSSIVSESLHAGAKAEKIDKKTRVVIKLREIMAACEAVKAMNVGGPISPQEMDSISDFVVQLDRVRSTLVGGKTVEEKDERSDLDALLNVGGRNWDFDNDVVKSYRKRYWEEHQKDDEAKRYSEWECPQYKSDLALPRNFVEKDALVELRYAPSRSELKQQLIKINVKQTETVKGVIAAAHAKLTRNMGTMVDLGPASEYVLKIHGSEAFMYGEHPFMSYEDIRLSVRQQKHLQVQLVKRPAPQVPDTTNAEEYASLVDHTADSAIVDDYRTAAMPTDFAVMDKIPLRSVTRPYRIRIVGADNTTLDSLPRMGQSVDSFKVETFLFVGEDKLEGSVYSTPPTAVKQNLRWEQWFMSDIKYDALPAYTRVGFALIGTKTDINKDILLAHAVINLIDDNGKLLTGARDVRLWPQSSKKDHGKGHGGKKKKDPAMIFKSGAKANNIKVGNIPVLRVQFDEFVCPVVCPRIDDVKAPNPMKLGFKFDIAKLNKKQNKLWTSICKSDRCYQLNKEEKAMVWMLRHHVTDRPEMLGKMLQSVDWSNQDYALEAYRLMGEWAWYDGGDSLQAAMALEFLDYKYADFFVRRWAVQKLDQLADPVLHPFFLQMVQCLKYESYHDSPLARMMMRRALANPLHIGHYFFWLLKAELHDAKFTERFTLMLEEYLAYSDVHSVRLRVQDTACEKLCAISEKIIKLTRAGTEEEAIKESYRQMLERLNQSFFEPHGGMSIPSDPRKHVKSLIIEKCRYMSSKMVPLWLVFENADPGAPPVYVMFKSGDDLRQDMLTLQLLNAMDTMWLDKGLDMRLKPYEVISTGVNEHGDGVGMIQPVTGSDTVSGIQLKYGGGAMGALKVDPLDLFIREHNVGKNRYERAVDNFTRSSAGYLVATYVLGIGDRHNGNIMLTKEGHLFHIDFGHFLGNFKSKFGVKRERAAFVFTPEMAYVMGGHKSKLFRSFLGLCSSAFEVLRSNANLLELLFALMVPAQMPELTVEKDIDYLRTKMGLNLKDAEADKLLRGEVKKSLASRYRRIDNMIHNWRHG